MKLLLMSSMCLALHFISTIAYADVPLLPQTGQTTSHAVGDAGDLQTGMSWPEPRFADNNNGTVTDGLTGLIWLKNANCFSNKEWFAAVESVSGLASGDCGLNDGSIVGQWRLPNVKELRSLVNEQQANPAVWLASQGFYNVQFLSYWSSSSSAGSTSDAWYVSMGFGSVNFGNKNNYGYIWPVRSGQ